MKRFYLFAVVGMVALFSGIIFPISVVDASFRPLTNWGASQGDGDPNDRGRDVAVDNAGNVYHYFMFDGTIDVDPSANTVNITNTNSSRDTALIKFDSNGAFQWVHQFEFETDAGYLANGGSRAINNTTGGYIDADSNGNIYISARFEGSIDLNPGGAGGAFTSADTIGDGQSIFLARIDSNGTFNWAMNIMDEPGTADTRELAVYNDEIYILGTFSNPYDFDTGAGTAIRGTTDSLSQPFIVKYELDGDFIWAIEPPTSAIAGTGHMFSWGMGVNASTVSLTTNVQSTGTVVTMDGIGGSDVTPTTSGVSSFVVTTYDTATGAYKEGTLFDHAGGAGSLFAFGAGVFSDDSVVIAGQVGVVFDMDPGAGVDNFPTPVGTYDSFIIKLDSNLDQVWSRVITGPGSHDRITEIEIDADDELFYTGNTNSNPIDLDPVGTDSIATLGSFDIFIGKLDSDGNYITGIILGSANYDELYKLDITNNVIGASGYFKGTSLEADFWGGNIDIAGVDGSRRSMVLSLRDVDSVFIDNLPANLTAQDVSTEDNAEIPNDSFLGAGRTIRLTDGVSGYAVAEIAVDMTTERDWTAAGITFDVDLATGKSFIHNLPLAAGTAASYDLLIPKIANYKAIRVCPGASSLGAVTEACAGGTDYSITHPSVSEVQINGIAYFRFTGATGTGGLGIGNTLAAYIDLTGQPATSPIIIDAAPEVAISSTTDFYISYAPDTTEFGATDIIDVVIPQDWSGLATCASSTTDADGDSTADGSMSIIDGQTIRFTFTGVTTTALSTGVELCFNATAPVTPANFSIAISDTNDGNFSAALIYVGDDNDVTITASIPLSLTLRIKEPTTTADTNACALGVLNPGSVNSCSYRLASGTNSASGFQIYVLADNQLNNAGDSQDIDDTPSSTDVTAGVEGHGVTVTPGTGFTLGGSFSSIADNPMPLTETLLTNTTAAIDDGDTATWTQITHSAGVNSGTASDSYDQLVTYRAWANS